MKPSMGAWLRFVPALAALLLLAGCIPVEDLGEQWDRGIIDPDLEGGWRTGEDEFLSFQREADHYLVLQVSAWGAELGPEEALPARTLALGEHKFLMLRVEDKEAGESYAGLVRYVVADDVLTVYQCEEEPLAEAIKEGRVKGRLPEAPVPEEEQAEAEEEPEVMDWGMATISILDDQAIAFLTELANDPESWAEEQRYHRVENLAEALAAARTYPATEDTPRNTLVNINLPDLDYLARGKAGLLLRHLQATPEWKVLEENEDIVCYPRCWEYGRWTAISEGPESDYWPGQVGGEWTQTRRLFRFAAEGGEAYAYELTRAAPLEGDVHLTLRKRYGRISSYLVVGREGLWFEVAEESAQEARVETRKAIQRLGKLARAVRQAEREIEQTGFAADLMPPESVRRGEPSLEIAGEEGFPSYDICAWVNPGEEGEVNLKVFSVDTGQELSEDALWQEPGEYLGWSKDPATLFLYSSHISVYEEDRDQPYDARFELWFHPAAGGPDRRLIETTHKITAWER
jgi:FAD/FMN-containing dehydrogenase